MKYGIKFAFLIISITLLTTLKLTAYSPTLSLGVSENRVFFDNSILESVNKTEIDAIFAWRYKFPEKGYFGFDSNVLFESYHYDNPVYSDLENINLELNLPYDKNIFTFMSGFSSSVIDDDSNLNYIQPYWEFEYKLNRGRHTIKPFVLYSGYNYSVENDTDDLLAQSAELGFSYRYGLRFGTTISFEAGFENWRESYLFSETGSLTSEKRDDTIFKGKLKFSGLIGYFFNWEIEADAGYSSSNANRYIASLSYLESDSETNFFMDWKGSVNWSPYRQWSFSFYVNSQPVFYINKSLLNSSGELTDEKLYTVESDCSLNLEWTSNDKLYLFSSISVSGFFSNNDSLNYADTTAGLGVRYIF